MLTLVVTAPDGTVTRNRPVMYSPQAAIAVATVLWTVLPGLPRRMAESFGLRVVRESIGVTTHHAETGYRFRIETEES